MFKPAVRSQAHIKLAITGPSGSGKTKGALVIGEGLGWKKVAVGDSENGSASLYAKAHKFDTVQIAPPYTTEKYIAVINEAVKQKYDGLILDTISHAWMGEGGILDQKNTKDEMGGNSFTNWNKFTPKQQAFLSAILHAPIDIIVTMRSKQEYALEPNDKGKMVPKKIGMAPQQREGVEYEFTTVFDIDMSHHATVSKDRTEIFDGKVFKVTKKTGELIREWLKGADITHAPSVLAEAPKATAEETYAQIEAMAAKIESKETQSVVMEVAIKARSENDMAELERILARVQEITGGK